MIKRHYCHSQIKLKLFQHLLGYMGSVNAVFEITISKKIWYEFYHVRLFKKLCSNAGVHKV